MRVFDISRELLSAPVYPGDKRPRLITKQALTHGDDCNVSDIEMCLHNGTHIDAPKHYLENGWDIEKLGVNVFCGVCDVITFDDHITGEDISNKLPEDCERLLIRSNGKGRLTFYALMDIVSSNLKLIGIDDISVAIDSAQNQVHRELLKNNIVLLEGLDLSKVPDGRYVLVCEPLKIKGADASPCRAILLKDIVIY